MGNNTYLERKMSGVCVRCGIRNAQPNRVCCRECALEDSARERDTKAYKRHREKIRAGRTMETSEKDIIQARTDRGECIMCGKKHSVGARLRMCMECRIRAEQNKNRVKTRIKSRVDGGVR